MTIRPPRPIARRRSPAFERDILIIGGVSFAVVSMLLRVILAVIGVERWSAAWRLISLVTWPIREPFKFIQGFNRTLVGHLTLGELLAAIVVGVTALVILSWLSNSRRFA